MSVIVDHSSTNNIADWTQVQLDAVIAGGAPPLPPPGTLLSDITKPSDWNDTHSVTLNGDLAALDALTGTGIAVRTATDTWALRTITGTSNQITVTNGDGVANNPVISLPSQIAITNTTAQINLAGSSAQFRTQGSAAGFFAVDASNNGKGIFYGNTLNLGSNTTTLYSGMLNIWDAPNGDAVSVIYAGGVMNVNKSTSFTGNILAEDFNVRAGQDLVSGYLTTDATKYLRFYNDGTYSAYIMQDDAGGEFRIWTNTVMNLYAQSTLMGVITTAGLTLNGGISLSTIGLASTRVIDAQGDQFQSVDLARFRIDNVGTPVKTRINKGGYFMTALIAAPADADINTSEMALWFDHTAGAAKLMVKAKNSAGTVVTGSIALT